MEKLKQASRITIIYVLALMMAAGYPVIALAEVTPASDSVSAAPVETPPVPKTVYTYNPDTSRWDSGKWQYDPGSGQYKTPKQAAPTLQSSEQAAVADSQPSETNQKDQPAVDTKSAASADTTANTNATILNQLKSDASSGDAHVNSNTKAENAKTGNANADTTIINAIHSTVQGDTAGIAHFQSDIYGNVTGDITLSPVIDETTKLLSSPATTDTTLQLDNNNQIINNISLGAASGNANVTHNTQAGDATTGTAHAVANVINLINSIIAANKSFIGTINIYGNLDGDILISPEFIPQLLASNAHGDSGTSSLSANLNDSQSIINNIALNATSGQANVDHNTSAGTATTGTAATNLTVLNLTGRQVTAKNSLLVFVNVLGKWVGVIVDAPIGATSAALSNGAVGDTTIGGVSSRQNIEATSASSITNNLTLNSQSGDANVVGNTKAGNATSGNVTASANILNMSMSSFNVSDWFGILFINVFGSWYGSFGVNTASGEVFPLDGMALESQQTQMVPKSFQFGFKPHASSTNTLDQAIGFFISQQQGRSVGDGAVVKFASTGFTGKNDHVATFDIEKSPVRNVFTSLAATAVGLTITMAGVILEIVRRRYTSKLA